LDFCLDLPDRYTPPCAAASKVNSPHLLTALPAIDIINTPTIGSGPLAPPVAGLLPRDDLQALNREASENPHSKRVEGSLDFIQNLLQADNITEL